MGTAAADRQAFQTSTTNTASCSVRETLSAITSEPVARQASPFEKITLRLSSM